MTKLTLHPPLIITPRLLPGVRFDDGTVSLDPEDLTIYIDHDELGEFEVGDFHPGPLPDDPSAAVRAMLGTVLSFLGAFAEAHDPYYADRDTENRDLFPVELGEWAYLNADEISMAGWELEHEDEEE